MDIKRSVARVKAALKNYGADESNVVDLLADMRHYCEANGLDFQAACNSSYMHYTAERYGGTNG